MSAPIHPARLIENSEHVELYFQSPSFKAAVDTLAKMLPAMIDGIAAQAAVQDAKQQAVIDELMKAPAMWVIPPECGGCP